MEKKDWNYCVLYRMIHLGSSNIGTIWLKEEGWTRFLVWPKRHAFLLVLPFKKISLQPAVSSPPWFRTQGTWCHSDSFIGLVLPQMRLFKNVIMLPLKRWLVTKLVPLKKWRLEQIFDVDSSRALTLWSLTLAAARWRCIHFIFTSCNVKVSIWFF